MIAHSLPDPFFGPASGMHGATYVVDAEFRTDQLNAKQVAIDIGLAHRLLDGVLNELNYQNLDELPQFNGILTTTEFLASYIHGQLKQALDQQFSGSLKVTLGESHVAWASYEAEI